jgi:hypothetical protein
MTTDTNVKFEGPTREREKGGNTAVNKTAEKHDGPRSTGKRVSQDAPISKCLDGETDSTLSDSEVSGKRREIGPAELVRRKNNLGSRDVRTNLGRGKPSDITVGGK